MKFSCLYIKITIYFKTKKKIFMRNKKVDQEINMNYSLFAKIEKPV